MISGRHPEAEVLEIFRIIQQAMLANDAETLAAYVADDYQGSDAGGRPHDRGQMLSAYGPGGVKLETFEVSEVETKSWADTVLVTGVGRIQGRFGKTGFEHHLRFLDLYARRGSSWKLVASHVADIARG